VFGELAPHNLVITNVANVITLKLTCPSSPGENTIVRVSAPQSAGRGVCKDFRVLGMCPEPQAGSSDITGLYTARYGVPPVGSKVFVRANQLVDGYDVPHEFVGIVPGWPVGGRVAGRGLALRSAPLAYGVRRMRITRS
jgi:hypothetical protein